MRMPLLWGSPEPSREPAVELGAAMQYTNILRDVGEDARRGKIYLPATLMGDWGVTPKTLLCDARGERFSGLWKRWRCARRFGTGVRWTG